MLQVRLQQQPRESQALQVAVQVVHETLQESALVLHQLQNCLGHSVHPHCLPSLPIRHVWQVQEVPLQVVQEVPLQVVQKQQQQMHD